MLLITDRGDPSRVGGWDDRTIVRLGEPLALAVPRASSIACDVDLRDDAMLQALRSALVQLRSCPTTPVHFVLRNHDIAAHALANALGATSISVETGRSLAPAGLIPVAAVDPAPPSDGSSVEDDIATVAEGLTRIFGAAAARATIAQDDLDQGVAALLRSVKEAGIGPWIEIVRRYDDATYQHCLLVAGLTAAFAAQLGLTNAKQRMLVQAALLHDIGKSRVPLETLNKAGPLTAAEQAQMRRHPVDGYYMLARQSGLMPGVLDVVMHHHELLDGTGYPDGLRGSQIAEVVRIVTICDIQAALIERRPYRKPMEMEDAFRLLLGMGGKLDGTLLATFRTIVDAMRHEGTARLRLSA